MLGYRRFQPSGGSGNLMPAHAFHSSNPGSDYRYLVLQRGYGFTSVTRVIPVNFALSVAKKPHIRLKARGGGATVKPYSPTSRHYIGDGPYQLGLIDQILPTEIAMTPRASSQYDTRWRRWMLAAVALVLASTSSAVAAD